MMPSPTPLKALTLYQPWAQLVALLAKQNETRSWSTDYRGPIAIHASKNTDWISDMLRQNAFRDALYDKEWETGLAETMRYVHHSATRALYFPLGAILAVANLIDCIQVPATPRRFPVKGKRLNVLIPPDPPELYFGDYRPGRFAWILDKVQMLPVPIACRGYQQVWDVPEQIAAQVYTQLDAK